jgi:hypothetical protein
MAEIEIWIVQWIDRGALRTWHYWSMLEIIKPQYSRWPPEPVAKE